MVLYEQGDRLGGQLHLAGAPPGREEFAALAGDLARQLAAGGVRVVLNRPVTRQVLDAEGPEAVVLATGGLPVAPPIPGADLPQVVQAWDVLAGQATVGSRVAVIGGGAVGVETALALAEQGTLSAEALKFLLLHAAEPPEDLQQLAVRGNKEIILVEMLDGLGTNFGKTTRWGMLQDVRRYGIGSRLTARVLAITSAGIRLEENGKIEEIAVDSVVLAVGTRLAQPPAGSPDGNGYPLPGGGGRRPAGNRPRCRASGICRRPQSGLRRRKGGFPMKKLILALSLLLLAAPSQALEVSGVSLPETVTINSRPLALNGYGIRKKFFFKIYVGALYTAQPAASLEQLRRAGGDQLIRMVFLHSRVGREKIVGAFAEGLEKNAPQIARSAGAKRFLALFTDDFVKGDVVDLELEGKGTIIARHNGRSLGSLTAPELVQGILAIYLGEHPADAELKEGMLGRKP